MRSLLPLLFLAFWVVPVLAQPAGSLDSGQAQALVERALATETLAARDSSHPMRFRLRKTTPRLTSCKEIIETRDGAVARLQTLFDQPLSSQQEADEQHRLDTLLVDPSLQQHRKQSEEGDFGIVLRILQMLPRAFVYQYEGLGQGTTGGAAGAVAKFAFRPNPQFTSPDLYTQALTAMSGEILIDLAAERVTRLEGHLQQDTDYGWGLLGKLNKGGWVVLEQSAVAGPQWRVTRFQMQMNLRVLFRNKPIDTSEEMTQYAPVSTRLDFRQAIAMLRAGGNGGRH